MREFIGQTALLESAEQELINGALTPTAPAIIPAALGDEPLTVEMLSAA